MELTLCNIGVHLVNKDYLVKGTRCCKACHKERSKEYRDKNKKSKKGQVVIPKTRVCKDCKKRKKITEFYKQKPPREPKFKPDYRWDCKQCHHKKVKAAYFKRTTKEDRRKYMTTYWRIRNNVLPSSYRVAA